MKLENNDKENIINNHTLKLTNLNKVYWPDEGYTKGELIDYYEKISDFILPYLIDRPESLHRYPDGIKGFNFYQKNVGDEHPDWIETKKIHSEEDNKEVNYIICQDKASLIYLANFGCIELNPWNSRVGHLDNPDYLIIDLDPEDISFDYVVKAALVVKKVLDEIGVKGFPKTSGASGMHIYIPLGAKYSYNKVRDFAHVLVKIINQSAPDFTSLERHPSKRQKKVYLDYLQNSRGQTLACPYSVRPKPLATVSTPLEWNELKSGLTPEDFTIKTIFNRIKKKGNLFKPVLGKGINIEQSLENIKQKNST